jgi:hypothetical protein
VSDANLAAIARDLAKALTKYARERDPMVQKDIARLHTELCAAYRDELADTASEPEKP